MPVIDLDSPASAGAERAVRRKPRALGVAVAGLLVLFGLSGEVNRGTGFLDEAICDYLNRLPSAEISVSAVVIDARSGEAQQTTTIEGPCVTRTGG
ncbi:hypothetical protein ACFY36_05315 [Actinoplanes sp. NPDC000266]